MSLRWVVSWSRSLTLAGAKISLEAMIAEGLADVGRNLYPDADDYFSWWAPWRNLRQRNIGWRLDYVLATESLAKRAVSCPSFREIGTSDHAPVVATFE